MGDFNKKPGETNLTGDIGTPANLIAPGKRMLSSMTPAMVVKDGKVVLVTGSPGGRTIINTVFTIVLGVVEYGLTGREAVDLARMHHQWLPDRVTIEKSAGPSEDVLAKLKAMGHDITAGGRQGDAHTIWVAPDGTVYGVNEKRTPDGKASVPSRLTSPAGAR
jgi:gamma-glutamyltranspeptidase/glutathione hydrolase